MSEGRLDAVNAAASPEVQMNAGFIALQPSGLFGYKGSTTLGLTLGLYGGVSSYLGTDTVNADRTILLTASATNYVECTIASPPVFSVNQSAFTAGRQRLYKIVTTASGIPAESITDYRTMLPAFAFSQPNFADNQKTGAGITGTPNGVLAAFTLSSTPSPAASLMLFTGGLLQRAGGVDYTLAGATVTFVTASLPQTSDILTGFWRY